MSDEKRLLELKEIIFDNLMSKINKINSEKDILENLRQRKQLNDIPLIVKTHFGFLNL